MQKRITILMSMLFTLFATQSFAQYDNIDFESATTGTGFTWIVDQNGTNPAMTYPANPVSGGINTSATVAQFTAEQAGQPWALTFTDDISTFTFDATNHMVKIMVYKTVISNVAIKFEGASAPIEIQVANTVVNAWEEITFDFSGSIGNSYNRLVVIPDFVARTQDNVIYFDNIQVPSGAPTTASALNLDFESAAAGTGFNWIVDQNGTNPAMTFPANPVSGGINTSATVAQFTAEQAGQPWALTFTDNITPFTFDATNNIIKIMVYKTVISNVAIKFEGASPAIEIQVPNTVVNAWEEITFDFSGSIGNSYNRLVVIPDFVARTQDNLIYFDNITASAGAASTTSDVTFNVDMNNYTGSTANGVFVNGTFNGWCGACNPMTDADGDGVWEVTLPLTNGTIEYKFTTDGWNDQEMFAGGEPCTMTTGANTNRTDVIAQDVTLPVVCWNSCTACGGGMAADSIDVTFQVNAALVATDAAGLFLAGGGTFGVPGDNAMDDADGDDVWTITVRLPKGMTTDYTFTNGNCPNWGCKENISNMPCAVAPYDDRNFPGAWSDTTVLACFGACDSDGTCPVPANMIDVTFEVDMNNETVDPAGVFLGGDFEGWSGGQALADADADGIWDITIAITEGSAIQWKFINGAGWATPEAFDSTHSACTEDFGGFINRTATLGSSDTTLPAFYFNSCDINVGTKAVFTKDELFEINPTLVSSEAIINFKEDAVFADKQIQVINAVGQVVFNETIGQTQQYRLDASNLTNGLYFIVIQSEGFAQTARILVSK